MKNTNMLLMLAISLLPFLNNCNKEDQDDEQKIETGTLTDSRDGHVYKWVKIGEQVWMAENLMYLPEVSQSFSGSVTQPFYYVYGYDGTDISTAKQQSGFTIYGVLYNWPAALEACPPGWNLPSDDEWRQLVNGAGKNPATKLKARSGWSDGGNGTDEFGFSALPGGLRWFDGTFIGRGYIGNWWSANESTSMNSWRYYISNEQGIIYRAENGWENGFSVRCVKNTE
jgi:uncharacterized protein (TIGR02145 family)